MKNTKKAFSLIEILLVLSITITFLIGVFYLYQKVSTDYKIKEFNRELTSISEQAINLAYSSGFDTINAGNLPPPKFPNDLIETSLVRIFRQDDPTYDSKFSSRTYKSPFGGTIVSHIFYSQGIGPSIFEGYSTISDIGKDPAVCVAIAYEQVRNEHVRFMAINYELIFETDHKTGLRDKSEKEIKNAIIPACERKYDGEYNTIQLVYS